MGVFVLNGILDLLAVREVSVDDELAEVILDPRTLLDLLDSANDYGPTGFPVKLNNEDSADEVIESEVYDQFVDLGLSSPEKVGDEEFRMLALKHEPYRI